MSHVADSDSHYKMYPATMEGWLGQEAYLQIGEQPWEPIPSCTKVASLYVQFDCLDQKKINLKEKVGGK